MRLQDSSRRLPPPLTILALCAVACLVLVPVGALAQPPAARPKLIVVVMADQFRFDYLTRFRDQYQGGLARLMRSGAVFTNAYHEHFPTVTAVGHATILSGATPSLSGIIGNDWYDRTSGRQVSSVSDDTVKMLGGSSRSSSGGAASPRRLLVSTLGDELKMAGRASKVIGVALKDRSAILPAGHMADGAYWFDPSSGNFVSSTYYFERLPAWVEDFNRSRLADKYLGAQWTPVGGGALFKKLPAEVGPPYYNAVESSPYGNELVEAFAEAALRSEQLGRRNATDVLAIGFSSNDTVGHAFGPDSPEVRDISIQTDRVLDRLFAFLDKEVGMRHVVIVFSSDHGVAPVPEVNQSRRMPGGRLSSAAIASAIQKRLEEAYGGGSWIVGRSGSSQYLNQALIAEKKLPPGEVEEAAADAVRRLPHVFRVYTRTQLARRGAGGDFVDRRVLNGFHHQRSPDVIMIQEPYYLFEGRGTSHGTPFQYDAHVPVIFLGQGFRGGRYQQAIAVNDVAPTLAALLDVARPSGSTGRVLVEALATPASAAAAATSAPPAARALRP